MIEHALRKRLEPIVRRQRHLRLAWRLSICWLVAGVVGLALLGANWLWAWGSSIAVGALALGVAVATIWILYATRRFHPDYRGVARNIEQHHPDLKALLLAAIEQEPEGPDGRLGYLQQRVLGDALSHATHHDWLRSISTGQRILANLGWIAALLFLIGVLSQVWPSTSSVFRTQEPASSRSGYRLTVTPGDTTVEVGAPVVILARFEGPLPAEVRLVFGASGAEPQETVLTRTLEDPVFGGIIPQVTSDGVYHIEYAGQRTRDYRVRVYEHPSLIRADARIVYPSYTELPEKVVEDTRQISVVEGSDVTLTFTLNKSVTSARLVPKTGIAPELVIDAKKPNVLIASLIATASQRYELQLADARGLTNKMPPRFVIEVHQNLPPTLKVVFPNRDVAASPLEELTLEAEVSDDYGVRDYGLSYALAGTPGRDITLGQSVSADAQQPIQHVLTLEDLGAEPDQLLTYYFWADDVGADGKPRRTASDIYFAEIRPFDEIFRESQSFQDQSSQSQQPNQQGQQPNQQADELARLQKQIISATWNIKQQADRSGGVDKQQEDLEVVRQSQADVREQAQSALAEAEDADAAAALQAAAEHMETSLDHLTEAAQSASAAELTPALGAEQAAYQELLKLRSREHQIAQSRNSNRPSNSSSARSDQQLRQLELSQEENRYETQRLAQAQEQTTQREDLQVLNRLRDLARRQNETSERLKEAQAALREAQNEQERQEALRELKRLRDEQLAALEDVDELQQRMERSENRQRMADARESLADSRSRIRQSAEELERGMVPQAITSATRAGRELEEMRDEFRRSTSSRFGEQMRDMREHARQLDERQQEIAEEIRQQIEPERKTLTGRSESQDLADRIDRQKAAAAELIDEMKDVSEQADASEPLLSKKLYDTLREASSENIDRALEATGELLRRNFLPQAQEIERQAGEGIEKMRTGVEAAADSVLGDEAESLRLARRQLDELIRQVDEEVARAGRDGQSPPGDPNEAAEAAAGEPRRADAQAGRRRPGQGQSSEESSQPGQASAAGEGAQPQGSPGEDSPPQGSATGQARAEAGQRGGPTGPGGGQERPEQWDGTGARGPLTGGDYRQWSDRLRDVEEMLNEQELRDEVVRVRERARTVRAEFTRHGKEPQWDLVREQIMKPLTELHERLSDKLAQLQSDEALVPIDRDPVPSRFVESVRKYYETLGGEQ